jgi:hypothetical protein
VVHLGSGHRLLRTYGPEWHRLENPLSAAVGSESPWPKSVVATDWDRQDAGRGNRVVTREANKLAGLVAVHSILKFRGAVRAIP